MPLGVWYNFGVSDCPCCLRSAEGSSGQAESTLAGGWKLVHHRPLGSCGIGGKGKMCPVPLFFIVLLHSLTTLSIYSQFPWCGPM